MSTTDNSSVYQTLWTLIAKVCKKLKICRVVIPRDKAIGDGSEYLPTWN